MKKSLAQKELLSEVLNSALC